MKVLIVAAGLLLVASAEPAVACSCGVGATSPSIYREWLKNFDGALFRGTLIEETQTGRFERTLTFRVERRWKGVNSPQMVLYARDSSCDVMARIGDTYLVSARWTNGRLSQHYCLHLFVSHDPKALLEGIGAGSPPPWR